METPMKMRAEPKPKSEEKMSKNKNFKSRPKRHKMKKMVDSINFWKKDGKKIFWPFLFFSTFSDLDEFEKL